MSPFSWAPDLEEHVSDLPEGQRGRALKDYGCQKCPLPIAMLGQVLELGWGTLESTEQLESRHTCRSSSGDLRQENEELTLA